MRLPLLSIAAALALFAAGCNAPLDVDGLEASYVDPPAGYEHAPRFDHKGARVYEVGGRYYREYNGRWVVFREKPKDLREEKAAEKPAEKREEKPAEKREEKREEKR